MKPISQKRIIIEAQWPNYKQYKLAGRKRVLDSIPLLRNFLSFLVSVIGLKATGTRNALDIRLEQIEFAFENLPQAFDGTRILFITDLHIDSLQGLSEKVINIINGLDYDFCVLGGDYSFKYGINIEAARSKMKDITNVLTAKSRVFAILGNHDKYSMAEFLHELGVEMLIDENTALDNNGEKLYLTGLDEFYLENDDDVELADQGIRQGAFKIMLCHASERFRQIACAGYSFMLTGHTHGGQVCLPGGFAPATSSTAPYKMAKGKWKYDDMSGYTSRGVGVTAVLVRFNCPPEITVITLKRKMKQEQ